MKNWLRIWKNRQTHDLEHLLRAGRATPPRDLVKAIMGQVRRRPVRPQLRIGRALAGATALALLLVGVSVVAGLGVGGSAKQAVHAISFSRTSFTPVSACTQYSLAPTISSIAPTSGTTGDAVTINGTNLDTVNDVTFDGVSVATPSSQTSTSIAVLVPPIADSGVVTVVVTNCNGQDSTSFTSYLAPSISSFSPASAHIGDTVTITGTHLTGVTSVHFAGAGSVAPASVSDTQVTVVVPSGATDGSLTVTNPAGTSAASATSLKIAPSVTSFSPTSAVPGTVVTITGTYFTGVTNVRFNGIDSPSFAANSDTTIKATVPTGAGTGKITVVTSDGSGVSTGDFTTVAIPSSITFAPTSGGVGTAVVVSGSNFTGTTAVKFGSTSVPSADIDVVSATEIDVHVPTGATTGKITVTNAAGSGTSSGSFTVLPAPTVSSFTPLNGVGGTTLVTINGKNFTGVTGVSFNGTPATSFGFVSDTKVTATVPSGASTGQITVTTAAGSGHSTGSFLVYQPPTITGLTPATQQAGGQITLTGTGFTGVNVAHTTCSTCGVMIDGTINVPTFTVTSDTSLTLTIPATGVGPGTHTVTVTNPANSATSGNFTVASLAAPVITSGAGGFSPADGPVGTEVTINGSGFLGTTSVTFNGKAATIVSVSSTVITADVPTGATTGLIKVTNKVTTGASTVSFVVDQPPKIVSFTPTSSTALPLSNSKTVTISGANFTLAGHTTTVQFGSDAAVAPLTSTATSITTSVPSGTTAGQVHLTVSVSGVGSSTSTGTFIVIGAPTIANDFSPAYGKVGTVVTINGSGFLGGNKPTVTFGGGHNSTSVVVKSDTQLTASVPSGATTGTITVTNDASSATSTASFTIQGAPTIGATGLNPTHGPANSVLTTQVTITGTNFDGVTSVLFSGKAATFGTPTSGGTQIVVTAPAGATTGKITINTPSGSATSTQTFTVDQPPTVTSFAPASPLGVAVAGTVTINGTNFIDSGVNADGVSFNGTPAGTFTVNSATKITATVPTGATTGKITVSNSVVGSGTSTGSLIVIQAPTLDATAPFSPTQGVVGTKVTLTGTGFSGGTGTQGAQLKVTFNGGSKTVVPTVTSDTSMSVTVPTGASTGTITVTNSVSSATTTSQFIVAVKPTVGLTGLSPASGPASSVATTIVDITGSNFDGTTKVLFNGTSSPAFSVDNDGDITAIVPAGAKTGKVTIVNPAGSAVSAQSFTVDASPVITSISPKQGKAGDDVTITGTGLVGELGGTSFPADTTVDFDGASGATVVGTATSTSVTVEVPNAAVTGPLVLSNVWGEQASSSIYTVVQAPTITSLLNEKTSSTNSGAAGQAILITGTGFTGTTGVSFHGTSATYTIITDKKILAFVPTGATTGTITVTNAAGTATSASFTIS